MHPTGIEGRRVTVSIGVATFPGHADSTDALVRVADAAMYEAKTAGKNCVRVAPVVVVDELAAG